MRPASRRATLRYRIRRLWWRVRLWLSDRCLELADLLVQDDPYEARAAVERATVTQRITRDRYLWEVRAESDAAAWVAFERAACLAPRVTR